MKPTPSPTAVYEDFRNAFPEMASAPQPGVRITSASDAKRDKAVREAYRSVVRQGWVNVTVVSLHSFPLDVNLGYLGHLTVPAKKQGDLFIKLVINQPKLDMVDKGDAN